MGLGLERGILVVTEIETEIETGIEIETEILVAETGILVAEIETGIETEILVTETGILVTETETGILVTETEVGIKTGILVTETGVLVAATGIEIEAETGIEIGIETETGIETGILVTETGIEIIEVKYVCQTVVDGVVISVVLFLLTHVCTCVGLVVVVYLHALVCHELNNKKIFQTFIYF